MRSGGVVVLSRIGWFIGSFRFPAILILRFAGLEEAKNLAGKVLRLIQDRL